MCKCIEKIEAEVKKKIIDGVKAKGDKIHEFVKESESGFQCKALMFSKGTWEFILPMEYKYIIGKKDGTPEKRTTTKKTNFIPSFCPICGKPIKL